MRIYRVIIAPAVNKDHHSPHAQKELDSSCHHRPLGHTWQHPKQTGPMFTSIGVPSAQKYLHLQLLDRHHQNKKRIEEMLLMRMYIIFSLLFI